MKHLKISLISLIALLVLASPSFATITMYTQGTNATYGGFEIWKNDKPNDGQGLITENAWAGAYNVKLGTTSSPLTTVFCIDLFLGIQTPGGTYQVNSLQGGSSGLSDATRVSRASWLFADVFPNISALANSYGTTASNIGSAIQFALWEIMNDYDASKTSGNVFSTGLFQTAASTDSIVRTIALELLFGSSNSARQALGVVNHWTSTVNTATANRVTVLVDQSFSYTTGPQRYIYYNPGNGVPEPATMSMIGLGLIAAGVLARRVRQ